MSNKAKTYIAPNRNGYRGGPHMPKCPPADPTTYPICKVCDLPVRPGEPRVERVSTRTPGHHMGLGTLHERCA